MSTTVRSGITRAPQLLGEVQVVLHERVLGAVHAADHAAPAQVAARAVGALAAEERVRDGLAGLAEVDADRRAFVGVAHAELLAELAQQLVGRVLVRVLRRRRASAAPRRSAARASLSQSCIPAHWRSSKNCFGGHVQRARVAEAAAADAAAGDDRDVLEGGQAEDALQAEARAPEVALQIGRRARELVVGEAPAALEHADRVALLGQAQRRHAAAEAGADHQPVEVVLSLALIVRAGPVALGRANPSVSGRVARSGLAWQGHPGEGGLSLTASRPPRHDPGASIRRGCLLRWRRAHYSLAVLKGCSGADLASINVGARRGPAVGIASVGRALSGDRRRPRAAKARAVSRPCRSRNPALAGARGTTESPTETGGGAGMWRRRISGRRRAAPRRCATQIESRTCCDSRVTESEELRTARPNIRIRRRRSTGCADELADTGRVTSAESATREGPRGQVIG